MPAALHGIARGKSSSQVMLQEKGETLERRRVMNVVDGRRLLISFAHLLAFHRSPSTLLMGHLIALLRQKHDARGPYIPPSSGDNRV